MEISIKAASDMFKISRNTIYERLKTGDLAKNANGKLDMDELFRVFGNPTEKYTRKEESEFIEQVKNTLKTEHQQDTLNSEREELYQFKIKTLEESLKQAFEREEWQRQHIEKLTDTLKLLEPPKAQEYSQTEKGQNRGFFSKFFRKN